MQLIAYVKSLGSQERERQMSTATVDIHEDPVESSVNYLNASYGIKLVAVHGRPQANRLDVSRRRITFMFMIGGVAAALMRLNLVEPQGALVEPETYNKLFSTHGIIMVFFFLVPSIPATLGNFLIPLMIGARDVAFPKLNLLQLVSVHHRLLRSRCSRSCRAASTPAGRSIRPTAALFAHAGRHQWRWASSSPASRRSSPA